MRECSRCHEIKDEKEFYKTKKGYYYHCISCQKIYIKAHYNNNKKYYIDKAHRHWLKIKNWFDEYKITLKCSRCSENHPAALDFHHSDPSEKDENIATLVKMGSKKKILEELKKCEVICSNCHRKLHWEEKQS